MRCVERFVRHFQGSQTEAGRRIGVSRQAVNHWIERGVIPIEHASKVDLATGGMVTRLEILEEHELRAQLRKKGGAKRKGAS